MLGGTWARCQNREWKIKNKGHAERGTTCANIYKSETFLMTVLMNIWIDLWLGPLFRLSWPTMRERQEAEQLPGCCPFLSCSVPYVFVASLCSFTAQVPIERLCWVDLGLHAA